MAVCAKLVDAKSMTEGRFDVIEAEARWCLATIAEVRQEMKTA